MTTEPTVRRALSTGAAVIAVDLRTPEAARAALGGDYPASCLYVEGGWLAQNKSTTGKLANAFVKTLRWIQTVRINSPLEALTGHLRTGV